MSTLWNVDNIKGINEQIRTVLSFSISITLVLLCYHYLHHHIELHGGNINWTDKMRNLGMRCRCDEVI